MSEIRPATPILENAYAPRPMAAFGGGGNGGFEYQKRQLDLARDSNNPPQGRNQHSYIPRAGYHRYQHEEDNISPPRHTRREGTLSLIEATTSSFAPKQQTGHPDMCDGDKAAFPSWVFQVQNKLSLDEDYFNYIGAEKTVSYIANRMKGDAIAGISHRVPQRGRLVNSPFLDPVELLTLLYKIYGEHNQIAKYHEEYHELEHGDQEFNDFFMKFERLATQLMIPNDIRVNDLKQKINDRHRTRVINMRTRGYDDLVGALQDLKYDMYIHDQARESRKREVAPAPPMLLAGLPVNVIRCLHSLHRPHP